MRRDSEHYSACNFCFNSHVYHSGMHLVLSNMRRPVDRRDPGPTLVSVLANQITYIRLWYPRRPLADWTDCLQSGPTPKGTLRYAY